MIQCLVLAPLPPETVLSGGRRLRIYPGPGLRKLCAMYVSVGRKRLGDIVACQGNGFTLPVTIETSGSSRGRSLRRNPGSPSRIKHCIYVAQHVVHVRFTMRVSSDSIQQCACRHRICVLQQPHHLVACPPIRPPKQGPNDDGASCTEIMGETCSPSVRRCFGHRPDLICAKRQDAGCHLEALCMWVWSGTRGLLMTSFLTGLGLATQPECRANGPKVNSGKRQCGEGDAHPT